VADGVYVVGAYTTAFGRKPETGLNELTREAYLGAVADGRDGIIGLDEALAAVAICERVR
jgi:acetyl-CoA acetyltransferase